MTPLFVAPKGSDIIAETGDNPTRNKNPPGDSKR